MHEEIPEERLQLLTIAQAARAAGIDRKLFRQAIDCGEIPCVHIATRPRIEKSTLDVYVRSRLRQARALATT